MKYCLECGKEMVMANSRRRYHGHQKIKGSCAHKHWVKIIHDYWKEKRKDAYYMNLWKAWNIKAVRKYKSKMK